VADRSARVVRWLIADLTVLLIVGAFVYVMGGAW